MRSILTNMNRYIALIFAIFCNSPAFAADWQSKGLDLTLEFSQQQLPIYSADNTARLRLNSYLIRINEYYGSRVKAGLLIGGIDARVRDLANSSHIDSAGYYMGLGMDISLLEHRALKLDGRLQIRYGDSDARIDQQSIELNWLQTDIHTRLSMLVTPALQLYGCASWHHLSGEHLAAGQQNFDHDIGLQRHDGYCAGIELHTADSGFIGIELGAAAQKGASIYFGRRFE